ncbi:oxalyl-CoA decarboxylase [Thermomonospora echinospora]|uniref:Oxalyl-CoA decarboxylase n=1 Tax=Thermomonospora echinospora TaxID=1992 RepID=A0A1H6E695_9ACTN|nr:oxalyl-CoA decarboxylase [Thermomonospora echinospora]SEG92773.1 oxalyl-CoA decarboxylase [Thermomonospora echinospora]
MASNVADTVAHPNGEITDGFTLTIEALRANGVENMYGVVGIPVTDLARIAQAKGIRYIGFRNEQAAGHAAAAAGFLTGRPGICLTVSAPGFLNGLVALANATTNCFPMIQISGSSERHIVDLQQGDYEELDQFNAARPFAKAAFRVDRPQDIGLGVARAIRAAVSGRPGGVYLDLPAAVLGATIAAEAGRASLVRVVDPAPAQIPAPESVARALDLLAHAERPLIVLGKGAAYARADEAIRSFVETTGIPYLPMSMAKGLLPDDHPQSAAAARSLVLGHADVVMLVGARLNWLLAHGQPPRWSATARFIQVDADPVEIDSNRPIDAPVVGDIASAMAAFTDALRPDQVTVPDDWWKAIRARTAQNVAKMHGRLAGDGARMNFSTALGAIRDVLDGHRDVYLVNEGANTLDFGRDILPMYLPRHRLDSGTWGVMGVGMGYAIAAAVESGKPVVAVEGDSAFGFSGMEIETICRYRLPVVTVIFNNGGIYKGDEVNANSADPAPTVLLHSSRYDKLIAAFGGTGYQVDTPDELDHALRAALRSDGPTLINAVIDPTAGTESGHLSSMNVTSSLQPAH